VPNCISIRKLIKPGRDEKEEEEGKNPLQDFYTRPKVIGGCVSLQNIGRNLIIQLPSHAS